jgi:hypothetical protein
MRKIQFMQLTELLLKSTQQCVVVWSNELDSAEKQEGMY